MDDYDDLPIEDCWQELLDKAWELVSIADGYSFGCIVLAWQKPEPGQTEAITVKTSELMSADERNRIVTMAAMGLDPNVHKAVMEMASRVTKRQWPIGMGPG